MYNVEMEVLIIPLVLRLCMVRMEQDHISEY